jgi:hypothetical protein
MARCLVPLCGAMHHLLCQGWGREAAGDAGAAATAVGG